MAKPNGFNKQPYGKLGNTVSYKLEGNDVCRGIGKLSKEEYHERESFEGARKNWTEFGMASGTAKLLRHSLKPEMQEWCGSYISGRLTGVLRRIIFLGKGEESKRSLETAHLHLLQGLALNRQKPKQAFLCTSDPLKIQTEQALVSLDKYVWELESWLGVKLREYHQITIGVIALSEIHHVKTI